MRKFWTITTIFLALALSIAPAEAKRFGGGKSFGKTHQTAPAKAAPQKQQAAPADKAQAGNTAAASAGKKGLMGGMLGGLLAGGLLGYMLGNGAFEGLQFMDMLIFGLVAFVLLRLLRRRVGSNTAQPAYNTAAAAPTPTNNTGMQREALFDQIGGFKQPDVPLNLPSDFDLTGFLVGAREHYRTLQEAWNKNDLSLIQEYVSADLYQELQTERATLNGEQHTEVLFVDAELVRADYDAFKAELSLKFVGRFRDTAESVEEDINDIWHLERDLSQENTSWLIVGIEA